MPIEIKDKNYDWNRNRKTPKTRKYPYEEWFSNSKPILLVSGTDFEIAVKSMCGCLHAAAKGLGYKIKTQTEQHEGKDAIAILVLKKPGQEEPEDKPAKGKRSRVSKKKA